MGARHLPAGGGLLLPCCRPATMVDVVGCTFVMPLQFLPAALLQRLLHLVLMRKLTAKWLVLAILLPMIMPPFLLQLLLSPPMWLPLALPMR